ncbi:S8 family serine peptidase [Proteiniborus sp. MB09-C3]|uniref:S8 family serine peptidase n=1 Tax=Proteiniborus sp. MB09-C3 TaxID=3050072 RepID=UPI002555F7F4|nr:S8 family serine peptidase [Proteiniborus sp. MB09-C3]WIV12986.1 S8 family serine peptidase [Proteiniborus sp. MB09-C3]
MPRSKKTRKGLSLLIALVMMLGSFASLSYAENDILSLAKLDLLKEASNKITPEVMNDLAKEDLIEVLVYMKDQVDTQMVARATRNAVSSYMTPYSQKLEVRKGIVEALRDKAELTQANLLTYLEQEMEKGNVEEYTPYHIVNMIYVKATKETIENISYMSEVEKIYKNKIHTMDFPVIEDKDIELSGTEPQWNITRVGADQAWSLGYDGTGAVVGSLDSGVDWTHPALKNHWRGYDPSTGATDPSKSWFDPVYNATLPADSDSHGTHVMGTMVGVEPDGNNPIGVAPGAKWITARVFNTAGSTTDAILLSAAEWMLHPGGDPTAAPDVVNNSWGGGAGIDDWYLEAVRAWRAAEILPVFSAGNQRSGEPLPWPGSISCPANYIESFAVAAVDRYDARASFSKLGPSPYDPSVIKPDISAPGVSIYSSIPGGYTAGYSGTSMSAPHISGTVALLVSANASLSIEDIEEIIENTADPLTDSTYPEAPNFGYGYGMVNAFEAVSQVATGTGYISGRVLKEGEDISEATIAHEQEVFEAFVGSDIDIVAEVSDDVSVTEVELLVKQTGKSYWMLAPMNRISGDHKDGVYKGTITYDMLGGDSIIYKIRARDYVGDVVITPDYKINISFGIVPGEYTQGFESNAVGWMFDGDWQWGKASGVDPVPFGGEGLAGTILGGNYSNGGDSWMITPPIDLRDENLDTASLRFHHWYQTETNYDNCYVLVTNDYGESWHQVGPIYTGGGAQWKELFVGLDSFIGSPDPVFIAYRFTTDSSGQQTGWYIDNVRLMGKDNEAPAMPTNLTAVAGMSGIKLSWTPSVDADVDVYRVYRSVVSGGGYELIGEVPNNNFLDTDIMANTTYYYVIDAVDFSGNVSSQTSEVSATAAEVTAIFNTDFEADNGGFVSGGTNNAWDWGVPTSGPNGAASGEKLWATNLAGNYPVNSDSYIESPDIVIPEDKTPILTFNHWYDFEGSTTLWDYGQVQVSKDNGATWTNVTPSGKYGTRLQTWRYEEIPLDDYRGETIKVRFFFHSDGSVAYQGWYVDDVNIVGIDYVEPPYDEIRYDDGSAENALVLNEAPNGLAVRFTPEETGTVLGAKIYFWDTTWPSPGGNRIGFAIYGTDENGTPYEVGEPIFMDIQRGAWNEIDLSSFEFSTDRDFYISTIQDNIGTQCPGTGIDESASGDRSYMNLDGVFQLIGSEDIEGGLMIRALVDYETDEVPVGNKVKSVEKMAVNAKDMVSQWSNVTEVKKQDYREPEAPKFSLKRAEIGNYKTVQDSEVQNTPMIMGGIPVADAVVTILETGRSVKVDPITGKYSMRVPTGNYTLMAEAYGYYPKEAEIAVSENETTKYSFMLEAKPRGSIVGRVKDRYYGNPAANAIIRVVEDPKVAPVVADENGYFEIPEILVGVYTLKVIAEGFEPGEFESIAINAGETTEVELGLRRFVGYEEEIIYDDGTAENALVLNNAPNGLAVRFTPEQFGKVTKAKIYFWDSSWPSPGGNRIGFTIYGTDENGTPYKVGEPIFTDIQRGAWNEIDLSSFGFSTDRDFYISTIQDKPGTECPGTGIDESASGDRSYMNLDGEFQLIGSEDIGGGLMIRATVENSVSTPLITNIGELTYTNQDSIIVEGTVGADCKVNAYVNGEMVASTNSENKGFAVEVELPLDENTIMVTSELEGRETEPSPTVRVIKDKVLPDLVVDSPADNIKINAEVVHVTGSASDNIELIKVLVNDKEVTVDEKGNFHERLMLNAGENVITVKALDRAGNETIIARTVTVELEAPEITNIEPSEDLELRAGDTLTVSFNAPTGGEGYFRILLPFGLSSNEIGIPMTEEDGLYTGTWAVPEGYVGTGLQVQVVYISESGFTITRIAEGRLTLIGDMENLAMNTVIVDNEAFNMDYLDNNPEAQAKMIEWLDTGNQIYFKLSEDTLVDGNGEIINIRLLPQRVTYFDVNGSITFYEQ